MLGDPASGRHLPAKVEILGCSQPSKEGVGQCNKTQEQEESLFDGRRAQP
jgi:hypothetical protein